MAIRKLTDTEIPEHYSRGLFEEKCLDLAPEHMTKILDAVFTGTANLLNNSKSMEQPAAFIIDRYDKQFIAACIVEFFENSDKNNPGNWSMTWTFNESDIPDGAKRIELSNGDTHSFIRSVAGAKYGMRFPDSGLLCTTVSYAFSSIKKWLDENASEGEETVVECEGLFQARSKVENGEKVFALEADGEIKNLIKDDAAIEK